MVLWPYVYRKSRGGISAWNLGLRWSCGDCKTKPKISLNAAMRKESKKSSWISHPLVLHSTSSSKLLNLECLKTLGLNTTDSEIYVYSANLFSELQTYILTVYLIFLFGLFKGTSKICVNLGLYLNTKCFPSRGPYPNKWHNCAVEENRNWIYPWHFPTTTHINPLWSHFDFTS